MSRLSACAGETFVITVPWGACNRIAGSHTSPCCQPACKQSQQSPSCSAVSKSIKSSLRVAKKSSGDNRHMSKEKPKLTTGSGHNLSAACGHLWHNLARLCLTCSGSVFQQCWGLLMYSSTLTRCCPSTHPHCQGCAAEPITRHS